MNKIETTILLIYSSLVGFACCLLFFFNEYPENSSKYYYTLRTTQYNGNSTDYKIADYNTHVHKKGLMYTHVKLIKYHADSLIEHSLQEICIYQSGDIVASERVGDGINNNDQ